MDPVTLGMAKAANKTYHSAQRSMLANPTAFFGDSLPSYGEGFPRHVANLSKQRIQVTGPAKQYMVFSYPGQDTANLLTHVADVLALNPLPRTVFVNGGTNDVIAAVPTATIMTNLKTICNMFEARGIRVVMSTIPPLGGPFQYNGKQQPARALNVAIREVANATGRPLVDPAAILVDPTTQRFQAAYDSGDNVHPSTTGIVAWANKILTDVSNLYPPAPNLVETTTSGGFTYSYYPDPPLNATGGNNGGTFSAGLAAALTCTTAYAGVVPSIVADASALFNWQRFTVSSTANGNLYYSTPFAVVPGHVMKASVKLRTGQTGGAFNVFVSNYHGASITDLNVPLYGVGATSVTIADSVLTAYWTVPAGATNAQLQISIPNVVGTYDFAQPTIYDLTALGAV